MSEHMHIALYRRLLLFLPRTLRRDFGEPMVAAFREDLTKARAYRSVLAIPRFWFSMIGDFLSTMLSEFAPQERPPTNRSEPREKERMIVPGILRDLRYGLRSLARAKGFTTLAVLIVTLGIGANATIFSISRALLWQAPPLVADPSGLVRMTRANEYTQSGSLMYPDYQHYRIANSVFDGLMAWNGYDRAVSMSLRGDIETVRLTTVSDNYFDVLGVPMAIGRDFLPEEDRVPGDGAVAVLSYGVWSRVFGADSAVIGTRIMLNGHPFTVIGVAPKRFAGVSPIETSPDIWAPLNMTGTLSNAGDGMLTRVEGEVYNWLNAVGRLRQGVTIEMARADLEGLAGYLAENFAAWNEGQSVRMTKHIGYTPSDHSTAMTIARLLISVAALVMTVSAVNIALILLARGSTKNHEISVRMALGAGRGLIVRQLLVESAILGVVGAVAGFFVSIWTTGPVTRLLPTNVDLDIHSGLPVLIYSLILGVSVVVLFGTIPALRSTSMESGARTTASRQRSLGRSGLVVAQMALSLVIVAGAILFTQSLRNARSVDLGFETDNRLVVAFNLRSHGYAADDVPTFLTSVLERVRSLPGVNGVSSTRMVPFEGNWGSSFTVPGVNPPEGSESFSAGFNAVGPDYFDVMRTPLLTGRGITARDVGNTEPVIVVNETLANQIWGTTDVIGRTITWRDRAWNVVGLSKDGTYYDLGEDPQAQVVIPVMQEPQTGIGLIVASEGEPTGLSRSITDIIHAVDPNIAITWTRTLTDVFNEEIGRYRVAATMVGIFGAVGVLLAAVGLYGVLSFLVSQRQREIGVRMALGASSRRVAGHVVNSGIRVATIGIVIGLLAALAGARLAASFLFGVQARDPLAFLAAAILLGGVAALASAIPARRAAQVDPMTSIRADT
jgi:predicted permease